MKSSRREFTAGLAGLAGLGSGLGAWLTTTPAAAAPRRVEAFDAGTWARLSNPAAGPAVVVFSTTYCGHCPSVLARLGEQLRQRKLGVPLIGVVMDVAPGEEDSALLGHGHYAAADRLLAFSGQATALRHAVDPAWRGVTPYVVLLSPGATQQQVAGGPPPALFDAWARRAAATRKP